MPTEIKSLGEFFQPERLLQYELMLGPQREKLELQKNEQHLEAQRNALAIMKEVSAEQMGALKEAYDRAPSPEVKLTIMNRWLKTGGVPIQLDRNDYEADGELFTQLMTNEPGSDAFNEASKTLFVRNPKLQEQADKQSRNAAASRGFRRLGAEVGLADLADTGEAIAASPPLQSKMAEARVVDPALQGLQDRAVGLKNGIARLNIEGQGLVQPAERATLLLSHAAPVASKLADIEAMTSPEARAAAKALLEKDDTEIAQFTKSIPQLKDAAGKAVAQLEQQQIQLNGALRLSKTGRPLPTGETVESLEAKVATTHQLLGLTRAEQAFYEHPTKSTLKSWQKAAEGVNTRVSEITTESQQLKVEREQLVTETGRAKAALSGKPEDRKQAIGELTGKAQSEFAKLPVKDRTPQAAAKISDRLFKETGLQVPVEEIRKATTGAVSSDLQSEFDKVFKAAGGQGGISVGMNADGSPNVQIGGGQADPKRLRQLTDSQLFLNDDVRKALLKTADLLEGKTSPAKPAGAGGPSPELTQSLRDRLGLPK